MTRPSATSALSDGVTFPAAYGLELVELASRFGVQPEALLDGTSVTLEELKDPRAHLAIPTLTTLVERARALTREPGLAFFMGMQNRLSSHGFLGFAAMTARDVREALELAVRYARIRTSAFALSTYVEGDTASLVLEERAPLGGLREFAVIALLVGIAHLGSALTGQLLSGVACCAFPEPDYLAAYAKRFAHLKLGVMRFGEPAHRLVFAASILDLPLVSADANAVQLARGACEKELSALAAASGVVGRVREAMLNDASGFRGLEEVGRALSMSSRTLKRVLAAQGTTFSEVRDDARKQRALLLLEEGRVTVADIAQRLGYSDEANFTRAFRRWTGTTPAAFRRKGE